MNIPYEQEDLFLTPTQFQSHTLLAYASLGVDDDGDMMRVLLYRNINFHTSMCYVYKIQSSESLVDG